MTHPPKAVETLALFICRNNHGHSDLDSLGLIDRRMILLRATKICDIIAPFYVDRLRADLVDRDKTIAELIAANARLVTDRTAIEAQLAAADRLANVARITHNLGAQTGKHWFKLGLELAAYRAIRGGGNG